MSGPIRIAHISDTHLGYRALNKAEPESGRNQRTVDVDRAFERAIDDILTRRVDAVIHGGDVFHHARPTWQSMRHFIRQMRRIEGAGIPTLVIAGNHDTPRIRTGGSAYSVIELALAEVRFVAEYEDIHEVDLFRHLDLHVHAIPHGALTNPDPVLSQVAPNRRNILVCHGMVPGILAPGVHAEPGEQQLEGALLDPAFDYIALGHYHVFTQASGKAWYSGSTERFGWGDHDVSPGYAIVTMGDPSDPVSVEHIDIPTRPMINLQPVNGRNLRARDIADAVISQLETVHAPDAMTRVDLRDVDRPTRREAESILRRETGPLAFSFTVAAERAAFTAGVEQAQGHEGVADLHTLFTEFVALRTGEHFDDEFARQFLDRGGRVLVDAAVSREAPAPEEDNVG